MELALYLSRLADLVDLDETLRVVDQSGSPRSAVQMFFDDVNSTEYFQHLGVLDWLDLVQAQGLSISRLYYGQEFCQELVPVRDEIERAYFTARQLGWDFTYVTGPVTDAGLERVAGNLEFLSEQDISVEVVVNDWGVLALTAREHATLHPVLGRLLVKQQRLARFKPASLPPVNMAQIQNSEEKIRENQLTALSGLNLVSEEYRAELSRLGVTRFELDITPQQVELPPDAWGFGVSCYFPWAYVTGGRNCLTASVSDPRREHVVLDEPCGKLCQTLNRGTMIGFSFPGIVQRGNTVFVLVTRYARPYIEGDIPVDRIIVEPFLPI